MSRLVVIVIVSLAAGLAIGAWISGEPEPPIDAPSGAAGHSDQSSTLLSTPDERLLKLEQAIAEEREARLILEDQLQILLEEIERIDAAGPRIYAEREVRAAQSRAEGARERRPQRDFASTMQDYQARRMSRLIDGGFSEDEARRVMQQESEAQFRAMQAMHEAQRNGETLDPVATMNGPQSILRAELGDSAYERYLEAQGQPTAIQVTQVFDGSPGSKAGLQPGDRIIGYNGERVFNVAELRSLTMQGIPGEDVIVEIDRQGVRMQLSLQRGPVGISGSGANIRSMNWWGGG